MAVGAVVAVVGNSGSSGSSSTSMSTGSLHRGSCRNLPMPGQHMSNFSDLSGELKSLKSNKCCVVLQACDSTGVIWDASSKP